ncbi:MAG: hypothetical protein ACWA40_04580 [Planktomarina sp.]
MRSLHHPYAWFPIRQGGIVLFTAAIFAAAVFGVSYAFQGVSVPHGKLYFGSLSQGAQPISVVLPQGAILSETIVSEGQRVSKGQTLAALNVAAIEKALARDEQKLLTKRFEQLCLLSDTPPDQIAIPSGIPKDTVAHLRLAKESCLATKDQSQSADIVALRDVLYERRSLLQDQLRLLQAEGQGRMEQAIKVLLAKSALDEDIARLKAQLNEQKLLRKARIAEAINTTQIAIAKLETDIEKRRLFLQTPRLVAPQSGMVTHVRHLDPKAGELRQETVLLNIIDPDAQEFHLNVEILEDDFAALGDYRIFDFRILGFDRRDSTALHAIWDAAQSQVRIENGKIIASLILTRETQEKLDQKLSRLLPKQTQYASRIEFSGVPIPVIDIVKGAYLHYF